MNVVVSLLLELLFLSQTLKNIFLGYCRDADPRQWGKSSGSGVGWRWL